MRGKFCPSKAICSEPYPLTNLNVMHCLAIVPNIVGQLVQAAEGALLCRKAQKHGKLYRQLYRKHTDLFHPPSTPCPRPAEGLL